MFFKITRTLCFKGSWAKALLPLPQLIMGYFSCPTVEEMLGSGELGSGCCSKRFAACG